MKTINESTIQRHIHEGGRYDERDDGTVMLYGRPPLNACGFCGALHTTEPRGWRDKDGMKIRCPECEVTK